jgi:hypothetical protein
MDGFLVIISIIDIVIMNFGSITSVTESNMTSNIMRMLKVFRLLRTLRPLRGWKRLFSFHLIDCPIISFIVINRAPGLKMVVQTLLSSLRSIGHIVIICCIFFVIFGILGVQVREREREMQLDIFSRLFKFHLRMY